MTLQGRLQDYIPYLTTQKLKVIKGLFELDINASQACSIFIAVFLWLAAPKG